MAGRYGSGRRVSRESQQIGYNATALVKNNSSSGNWYTPSSFTACGFLIYKANGVKSPNNSLFNNEKNLCNFGKGAASSSRRRRSRTARSIQARGAVLRDGPSRLTLLHARPYATRMVPLICGPWTRQTKR